MNRYPKPTVLAEKRAVEKLEGVPVLVSGKWEVRHFQAIEVKGGRRARSSPWWLRYRKKPKDVSEFASGGDRGNRVVGVTEMEPTIAVRERCYDCAPQEGLISLFTRTHFSRMPPTKAWLFTPLLSSDHAARK